MNLELAVCILFVNPKPYKSGNILCYGLLTCKKCSGVWNRDVNSATNIYNCKKCN
jgi:transposase